MKKGFQHIGFLILILLGIGQLPSMVGRGFLSLALLVFPNPKVQCFVEQMLTNLCKRWFWFTLFFLYLRFLPLEEIQLAGENMGRFLRGIVDWIYYISGK